MQDIKIPYHTGWIWVLFTISVILFLFLSISIAGVSKNETKAELVISYIILSSIMFIGTIPFFIRTVMDNISKNVGLFVLYIFILIFSIINFAISGILLNKLDKEEEEIKNYSGALIFLSFALFVCFLVAGIIETKNQKKG